MSEDKELIIHYCGLFFAWLSITGAIIGGSIHPLYCLLAPLGGAVGGYVILRGLDDVTPYGGDDY